MRKTTLTLALAVLALTAACETVAINQPGTVPRPQALEAEYRWSLEAWSGGNPVGTPLVLLRWEMPSAWNGEAFRVYSRRAGTGAYVAAATVTSCAARVCTYADANIAPGAAYEYYVVGVDEARRAESTPSNSVSIAVPAATAPARPASLGAVALDNRVYLHWQAGAGADSVARYLVYLVRLNQQGTLYPVGETDGTGFVDVRAENGNAYHYRVAAVNFNGHVSAFSDSVRVVPRPDYQAELMYAAGASPDSAGFRFTRSGQTSPIRSATSTEAQWSLELIDGVPHLRPRGETTVAAPGAFTTALSCGPASDPGCIDVRVAPTAGYTTQPVAVRPEYTYVLRVRDSDGQFHYGKVRVQHIGPAGAGRTLMIFGWAYQLIAGEVSLSVHPE
jgi:hypothetical protein